MVNPLLVTAYVFAGFTQVDQLPRVPVTDSVGVLRLLAVAELHAKPTKETGYNLTASQVRFWWSDPDRFAIWLETAGRLGLIIEEGIWPWDLKRRQRAWEENQDHVFNHVWVGMCIVRHRAMGQTHPQDPAGP